MKRQKGKEKRKVSSENWDIILFAIKLYIKNLSLIHGQHEGSF
jgi:hypothetical protein